MFDPVSQRVSFPKLEEELLDFWEKEGIFEKSVEAAKDQIGRASCRERV